MINLQHHEYTPKDSQRNGRVSSDNGMSLNVRILQQIIITKALIMMLSFISFSSKKVKNTDIEHQPQPIDIERNNFIVIYEGNFIFCMFSLYRRFSASTLREKQSIHPLSILSFCSRYTCFPWRTTDEDDGNRNMVMVFVLVSVMISCNCFLMLSTNFNRSVSNSKSSC